jgi:hypothetical protein
METADNTKFIFKTTIDGDVFYIAIIHLFYERINKKVYLYDPQHRYRIKFYIYGEEELYNAPTDFLKNKRIGKKIMIVNNENSEIIELQSKNNVSYGYNLGFFKKTGENSYSNFYLTFPYFHYNYILLPALFKEEDIIGFTDYEILVNRFMLPTSKLYLEICKEFKQVPNSNVSEILDNIEIEDI